MTNETSLTLLWTFQQERMGINDMMGKLMKGILMDKPRDPVQYLIDAITFGNTELAAQVRRVMTRRSKTSLTSRYARMFLLVQRKKMAMTTPQYIY